MRIRAKIYVKLFLNMVPSLNLNHINFLKVYVTFKLPNKMLKVRLSKILAYDDNIEPTSKFYEECKTYLNENTLIEEGKELIINYFEQQYRSNHRKNDKKELKKLIDEINKKKITIDFELKTKDDSLRLEFIKNAGEK